MNVYKITAVLIFIFVSYLVIYSQSSIDKKTERSQYIKTKEKDIKVAVVWQSDYKAGFLKGIELAQKEINSKGGILDKKLEILFYEEDDEKSSELSKKIANNLGICAVIGYSSSTNALPAAVTYETNGMLFLASGATTPMLTSKNFQFVFRNINNDADSAKALADLTQKLGYKRVFIISVRTPYGTALSNYYKERVLKNGLKVVGQKSYNTWDSDLKPMIASIKEDKFDVIFLAGSGVKAGEVIKQARTMWIKEPIIGGDGLNNPNIPKIAGSDANGLITFGFFDPEIENESVKSFSEKFYAEYKEEPDDWAVQGYDALMTLKDTIIRSKSNDPSLLASTLKYSGEFNNPAGPYTFNDKGDITSLNIVFKVLQDGIYKKLEVEK